MRIPKFKSIKEEAEFWDTHDITSLLEDMDIEEIKFVRKEPLTTLSFRIEKDKVERLKKIARDLNMPYTVLIRKIIDEALAHAKK